MPKKNQTCLLIELKELILQYVSNCSDSSSWDTYQLLKSYQQTNNELPFFINVEYESELIYQSYCEDLNDLLSIAGEICLTNVSGISVNILRTTPFGEVGIFHQGPIKMITSFLI